MSGTRALPFRGARVLTLGLAALLVIDTGLGWVALQAGFVFVELLWRAVAAPGDYGALLQAHVRQFRALRSIQAVAWGASAVLFLRWLYRVECDLLALGARGLQYSPRSAVMAFAIPVVNLVRPLVVMREVWAVTDPRTCLASRPLIRTPIRLTAWWVSVVAATSADVAARALAWRSGAPLDVGPAMQLFLLGQGVALAAGPLSIAVTAAVDRRLTEAALAHGESRTRGVD